MSGPVVHKLQKSVSLGEVVQVGQLDSGKVCTPLGGLWRTVVSLIRGVNGRASNNRLKEFDLILLPGMDDMVSKCTEGCSEEKVKRSTEFYSDKSRNHRGQTLGEFHLAGRGR